MSSGFSSTASGSDRKPQILCVDDEPHVLEGLKDTLRRSFDVRIATSGQAGLERLSGDPGGYAVVMSDMRMPVMQGSVFLREARRIAPDAVRILLTGYSDVESAAAAVNDGQLFRFLTKPCDAEELQRACAAAVGHHRLLVAERVLLEQTLRGSVQAMADVLALASPVAFGRSTRVKAVIPRLAQAVGMDEGWEVEVAATMASIGAITLPEAVAEKLYAGSTMSPQEAAMIARVPAVTRGIVQHIPRLEGVLRILDNLDRRYDSTAEDDELPIGSRMLRIVFDYDGLVSQGIGSDVALGTMRAREGVYDGELLDAFAEINVIADAPPMREIPLAALRSGMILLDDVRAATGTLLIARGHPASPELVMRLNNFPRGFVREPLRIDDRGAGRP